VCGFVVESVSQGWRGRGREGSREIGTEGKKEGGGERERMER